jgi:hypothetical protein
MIKIIQDKSGARVIASCDQCAKEITNGHDAFYAWEMDTVDNWSVDCFTVHRTCLQSFERNSNFRFMGTIELACLPVYLANNLHIDRKKAETTAKAMSLI